MRELFVASFIIFCIGFQVLVTYFCWEVYPFNPSTMYSHKFRYQDYVDLSFNFVDQPGEEHKMERWHIQPMDPQRLFIGLLSIDRKYPGDRIKMDGYAKNTFGIYLSNIKKNEIKKEFIGFRIYRTFWRNKEAFLNRTPSERKLMGEFFEN